MSTRSVFASPGFLLLPMAAVAACLCLGCPSGPVRPPVTPPDPPDPWYLYGLAVSLDEIDDAFSAKVVADPTVADALSDALDQAQEGDFGDAFAQFDIDENVLATGLYFAQFDEDYAVTALGLPTVSISQAGFFAEELQIPFKIRDEGPIVAITGDTLAAFDGLFDPLIRGIQEAFPATPEMLEISAILDGITETLNEIPSFPNSTGVASFAKNLEFPLTLQYEPPVPGTLTLDFEIDVVETNPEDGRWEGAVSVFGEWAPIVPSETGPQAESLGMTIAVGAQLIKSPEVVFIEAGDGTVVNDSRLSGTWTAEYSGADLFGNPEMSGFLRLVFDESGQWTDVLVAESQGELLPEPAEFTSLMDELEALLDKLEQDYGIEIPDPELRVTLDEGGEIELNFLIPDLGKILQTLIEQSLATLDGEVDANLEFDLSGLPDLPIVSFIGQLESGLLDGNILLGPLFEPFVFVHD